MKKMTIDGNMATAHVAYAYSDVTAIYPITPSSGMAENCDEFASHGRKNLFGNVLHIEEMESEAGAAGAVHGALTAGALTTTFTASQGLLLMIPNMYKIAGELLPCVFHVSARALATHALSIFGDQADVMACRQTGFAMLCSNSVQEAMDLALVAHLSTLRSSVPFVHFFDGFRTSHEIAKIDVIDYEEMRSITDFEDIEKFKARALNPEHPMQHGTAQNPDTYFQNKEAANKFFNAVPNIVEEMMGRVETITGRKYKLYDYYGAEDAEKVIVVMGSGAETITETIDYLMAKGEKVGVVKIHLYRPFVTSKFVEAIPQTTKYITVLDRTKEPGSVGEPLYLDVIAALAEEGRQARVLCGRYGLGSKEFNPSMVNTVYKNMGSENKNHFTIGITDDITFTSLPVTEKINTAPAGTISCMFYGFGSDGTVGANKDAIKIIGDHTEKYAQGYFSYDSKKSGGLTVSHLRFGNNPIRSTYLIDQADFIACSKESYVSSYNMIKDLKEGGTFLLNTIWTEAELEEKLPASMKNMIARKHIKFYTLNSLKVLKEIGALKGVNTAMQAAFFYLSEVIPFKEAREYIKSSIEKTYFKKGEAVIQMNWKCIDKAIENLQQIKYPASWENTIKGTLPAKLLNNKYLQEVIRPIIAQEGNNLPSSAFSPDGFVPVGTTKYEKRGIANFVPTWNPANCIECNQCSLVCPHAAIRPVLATQEELSSAPGDFITKPAIGFPGYEYRIQVSPLDCTGCQNCVSMCPGMRGEKALAMIPVAESIQAEKEKWDYVEAMPETTAVFDRTKTAKGSQFSKPLFEFSGACAGCGETPYIKLITQLFGERMMIANATGCSSIYGGSSPTCPYTTNDKGYGPAWANSLFEDNAEFGLGMNFAMLSRKNSIKNSMNKAIECGISDELKNAFEEWIDHVEDAQGSEIAAKKINTLIDEQYNKAEGELRSSLKSIKDNKDNLVKKSMWIVGGDGWAYDIGYNGLDHAIASGADINILVLDTEVYSNTGGQASKSTPAGAVAKFAATGKKQKKKDLGALAMNYGHVYVAQVSMGANMHQVVKAFAEAEAYHGPSLILAYSPCINHGINMAESLLEMKKAVDCGYWQLFRYHPDLVGTDQAPLVIDSREPTGDYQEFLKSETRYSSLLKQNPEAAAELFAKNEADAKAKRESYIKRAAELANKE